MLCADDVLDAVEFKVRSTIARDDDDDDDADDDEDDDDDDGSVVLGCA